MSKLYDEMHEAMKTLDKRIIEEWSGVFDHDGYSIGNIDFSSKSINQRAKELGFIGKYRWGVEYPTNGKRPELADDVLISVAGTMINGNWYVHEFTRLTVDWSDAIKFRVIDPRYKPVDEFTVNHSSMSDISSGDKIIIKGLDRVDNDFSHLDDEDGLDIIEKHLSEPDDSLSGRAVMAEANSNWHERGELPPVGSFVSYHDDDGYVKSGYSKDWIEGDKLEILSHKTVSKMRMCVVFNMRAENAQCLVAEGMRPIRTEREKVIEAAVKIYDDKKCFSAESFASELHKAGMLVLPPNKSDTKD